MGETSMQGIHLVSHLFTSQPGEITYLLLEGCLWLVQTQMQGMVNQDGAAFTELFILVILQLLVSSFSLVLLSHWNTWGFRRGGCLGHPDFDIHSGQAAVITPRQVTSGLGACRVKAVAAAKHHTVVATEGGEVFTWGSNREGQLGYMTPRTTQHLGE